MPRDNVQMTIELIAHEFLSGAVDWCHYLVRASLCSGIHLDKAMTINPINDG